MKSSKLKKISKLQKRCVRNIAGKGHRSHSDPLFSKFDILKFEDLFKFNCSVFMHKYVLVKLSLSFGNFLQEMAPPNRTKGFVIDKVKSDYLYQFPSYFYLTKFPDLKHIQTH